MIIIPAIDLKNGQCVRLRQGQLDDETVFSDSPIDMAAHWVEQGARRLHMVDLDGAVQGKPVHAEVVAAVCQRFPDLPVQIGGGIRTLESIQGYLDAGASYAIIGTQAVKEPAFVAEACRAFPGKIIVGLDAKNSYVATEGWLETSSVTAVSLAQQFEGEGVAAIVYTDISRDGMMQGANIEETAKLAENISIPVIVSGGVTTEDDVSAIARCGDSGIMGMIAGRALYEKTLNLTAAQTLLDGAVA